MPMYHLDPNNSVQAAYFRIKFKDVFDLKEFYAILKDWMLEYEWAGVDSQKKIESGGAAEQFETFHWEREDVGGSKEQWWWWRLQKLSPNSFYKYHMDIDFHNLGITPTEVVKDGKKFKVQKGETEIKVWTFLEYDASKHFSKNPILKHFKDWYVKRIFQKELYADHKMELYRETYILQAFMKRWMQLQNFLPFEDVEPFHPPKSFPGWKK